jgi:preprotein translocase subunit SecB
MVQNSPLQLEVYFLKEFLFALTDGLEEIPGKAVQHDNLSIDVTSEVETRNNEPRSFRCELTVESKNQEGHNYPYRFRVTYVGFFRMIEEIPADRVDLIARTNAPAILYSAAREALLPITSRGPYPGMMLPSITFLPPPSAEESPKEEAPKLNRATLKPAPRKTSARKAAKKKPS